MGVCVAASLPAAGADTILFPTYSGMNSCGRLRRRLAPRRRSLMSRAMTQTGGSHLPRPEMYVFEKTERVLFF